MALVPLATKGNYFHVYDFRVKAGRSDEFVELFNKFDYGDNNPFHRSRAQVKDITAYLKNGGTLEKAAAMANHASTRTTQLYDRRRDEVSLDEVERIVI